MTERNELNEQPVHATPLTTHVLQGAGLAAILFILFLLIGGEWNSGSRAWVILPLIMVPLAGALGGVVIYLMDYLRYQGGWKRTMANVFSTLVYFSLLLVGFVLGMNGPN